MKQGQWGWENEGKRIDDKCDQGNIDADKGKGIDVIGNWSKYTDKGNVSKDNETMDNEGKGNEIKGKGVTDNGEGERKLRQCEKGQGGRG